MPNGKCVNLWEFRRNAKPFNARTRARKTSSMRDTHAPFDPLWQFGSMSHRSDHYYLLQSPVSSLQSPVFGCYNARNRHRHNAQPKRADELLSYFFSSQREQGTHRTRGACLVDTTARKKITRNWQPPRRQSQPNLEQINFWNRNPSLIPVASRIAAAVVAVVASLWKTRMSHFILWVLISIC